MLNQSLLDDLLCLSRVVVPTARCFSSDSYAGSVISRSTDSAGRVRSQPTASSVNSSNDAEDFTVGTAILRRPVCVTRLTGQVTHAAKISSPAFHYNREHTPGAAPDTARVLSCQAMPRSERDGDVVRATGWRCGAGCRG